MVRTSLAHPTGVTWPDALRPVRGQRGAASLIVVMVLFFVMALAAAYSSRNLIFEQRTSANQYRSTQAIEAAEAGVEWALAMLNGGRIGTDCLEASAAANATTFRQRYLTVLDDGRLRPVADPSAAAPTAPAPPTPLTAGCVFNGTDWVCSCPVAGPPVLAAPVGEGPFPAFRVRFSVYDPLLPNVNSPTIFRSGLVTIEVNGCTRLDGPGQNCLGFPGAGSDQEGRATLYTMVGLKSALPALPSAALTVLDGVEGLLKVVNTDAETGGVTVRAGGVIDATGLNLRSIPGSWGDSTLASDLQLAAATPQSLRTPVLPLNPNRVFSSVFGAVPDTYRQQPAAIAFDCPATGCRADLAAKVEANPGRVIWVNGNLVLESDGDIGSPPDPANPAVTGPTVIVATGRVLSSANVRIYGFVYSQPPAADPSTENLTGGIDVRGAAFIEAARTGGSASGQIVFDREVLQHLQQRSGSFVRIPGGWRDFP